MKLVLLLASGLSMNAQMCSSGRYVSHTPYERATPQVAPIEKTAFSLPEGFLKNNQLSADKKFPIPGENEVLDQAMISHFQPLDECSQKLLDEGSKGFVSFDEVRYEGKIDASSCHGAGASLQYQLVIRCNNQNLNAFHEKSLTEFNPKEECKTGYLYLWNSRLDSKNGSELHAISSPANESCTILPDGDGWKSNGCVDILVTPNKGFRRLIHKNLRESADNKVVGSMLAFVNGWNGTVTFPAEGSPDIKLQYQDSVVEAQLE